MNLALARGVSLARLLATTSSRELSEYEALNEVDPFTRDRWDLLAAIVAATVANAFRGKGKAMRPADFVPNWDANAPKETSIPSFEEMRGRIMSASGKVSRNGS